MSRARIFYKHRIIHAYIWLISLQIQFFVYIICILRTFHKKYIQSSFQSHYFFDFQSFSIQYPIPSAFSLKRTFNCNRPKKKKDWNKVKNIIQTTDYQIPFKTQNLLHMSTHNMLKKKKKKHVCMYWIKPITFNSCPCSDSTHSLYLHCVHCI